MGRVLVDVRVNQQFKGPSLMDRNWLNKLKLQVNRIENTNDHELDVILSKQATICRNELGTLTLSPRAM